MTLYLGSEPYGQRRWQDFWWPEETILDFLNRPLVRTCNQCQGVNWEHEPGCPASVALALQNAESSGMTKTQANEWAEEHAKAGFPELAKHWRLVAERIAS